MAGKLNIATIPVKKKDPVMISPAEYMVKNSTKILEDWKKCERIS